MFVIENRNTHTHKQVEGHRDNSEWHLVCLPVDGGLIGLCGTEFSVPVFGCVLVIVTELGLCQEGAELFSLFWAHPQMSTMQILFHMHKKQVSVEQNRKTKRVSDEWKQVAGGTVESEGSTYGCRQVVWQESESDPRRLKQVMGNFPYKNTSCTCSCVLDPSSILARSMNRDY